MIPILSQIGSFAPNYCGPPRAWLLSLLLCFDSVAKEGSH
jgi:hypothetical protein